MRDVMRAVVMGGMLVVLGASVAAAAPPPGRKCQSAKNQEAGKYAACLSKAEAKLLKAPGSCSVTTATECYADGDCPSSETCAKSQEDTDKFDATVGKCLSKFNGKWDSLTEKAAAAGDPCPDGLLVEEIKEAVDQHVTRVAARLAGGPRFEDNGDGTITDNDTGLMWEKKVDLDFGPDLANRQDVDNFYLWSGTCSIGGADCQPDAASEAACVAGVEGDPTGCAQCVSGVCDVSFPGETVWQWLAALNTANYGGHADWRLAKLQELQSIVDYADSVPPAVNVAFQGASCGGDCTDVNNPACSCTESAWWYWSGSTYAPRPDIAWVVDFERGDTTSFTKTSPLFVRAVRGGS